MLPVCQALRAKGALPLTRTRKRNGSARARQHETALLRDEIRDEREVHVKRAEGAEAIQPARAAQRQVRRRKQTLATTLGVLPSTLAHTLGVLPSTPAPTHGVMSASDDTPEA